MNGRVEQLIVQLDQRLTRQLDAILHHPRLQRLEASWRGLQSLVQLAAAAADDTHSIRLRILNIGWRELANDVTRALEFDQSHVFRCIYSQTFGMPGGEPFGVILGDYAVSHRMRPGMPTDDTRVLGEMAQIAAAALCPFIVNADSALLGLDSHRDLRATDSLEALFRHADYRQWNTLRQDEHSRFLGLTLPRVLMRRPYRDDGTRNDGLAYREECAGDTGHYLWGHACYAFGGVLLRAYADNGWFADIRGGGHESGDGGEARRLIHAPFDLDNRGLLPRPATEVRLDDLSERCLSESGLIPLCSQNGSGTAVFFSNSSLHAPQDYDSDNAGLNARLSAMIQYMLCVSRFGHYIKLMVRDWTGSIVNTTDCQRRLQEWLNRYTTASEDSSAELKARYPLASSRVELMEQPGRPGHLSCVIHLQPHFQLDQLMSSIRLVTELAVGTTDPVH